LNIGFQRASHGLVVVTDPDIHLHPRAVKLLAPIHPLAYWALAALRSEVSALFAAPREKRAVWNVPREQAATSEKGEAA
jgi:hypothetical protein